MLKENPFYILGASLQDNRQKIVELAEDKSFEIDEDLCQKARSDLTMPKNRIIAELDWLIDIAPNDIDLYISKISINDKTLCDIKNIHNLSKINILSDLLSSKDIEFNKQELQKVIKNIAYCFECIDIDNIISIINKNRNISGFIEFNNNEFATEHLLNKKRNCIKIILKQIDTLDTLELIDLMTDIVDKETVNGEKQASSVVEDLVDEYKLHTQSFLENEFEKIKELIKFIKLNANKGEKAISPLIDELLKIVETWDSVAQPIQLSLKSRGLEDILSNDVAREIRLLGIDLYNNFGYLKLAKQISKVLKRLFAELPAMLEIIENDIDTLENRF